MSNSRLTIPASRKGSITSIIRTRINTNRNPHQQPLTNIRGIQINIIGEWIIIIIRLTGSPLIIIITDNRLRISIIRRRGLNRTSQRLIKEQLSDMIDFSSDDGVVGECRLVEVRNDVLVDSSSGVMSGENGVEGCYSIRIGRLEAT